MTILPFYDGKTYTTTDSMGLLVRNLSLAFTRLADKRMLAHGLTDAQWKPLFILKNETGNVTAADLARFLNIDTGAVTRMIDRLECKGLLSRHRSEVDRRLVNLELTEEGKKVSEIVPYVLAETSNAVLEGFSEAEFDQVKSLLQRMLLNAQSLGG